jgi:hypothetical protein
LLKSFIILFLSTDNKARAHDVLKSVMTRREKKAPDAPLTDSETRSVRVAGREMRNVRARSERVSQMVQQDGNSNSKASSSLRQDDDDDSRESTTQYGAEGEGSDMGKNGRLKKGRIADCDLTFLQDLE